MTPHVELAEVDVVSPEAQVCHYDELGEKTKHRLPDLAAADGPTPVDSETAAGFNGCELVKYTDYYRVRRGT